MGELVAVLLGNETGTQLVSRTRTRLVSRLGWPALRTNRVAEAQLAHLALHPLLLTERSAPLDAHSQPCQFLRAQRRIHSIGPIHRAFHGPRREDGLDRIVPMIPRPQAAPTPDLRSRNTPCTHGIPLDVSQNGQQMFVALHREALESSLIKMSVTHGPMRDP